MSALGKIIADAIVASLPCQGCNSKGEKTAKCHYCKNIFCTASCCKKHFRVCPSYLARDEKKEHIIRLTTNSHDCQILIGECRTKKFSADYFCETCQKYMCSSCKKNGIHISSKLNKEEELKLLKAIVLSLEIMGKTIELYELEKTKERKSVSKSDYELALSRRDEIRRNHGGSSTLYLEKLKTKIKDLGS